MQDDFVVVFLFRPRLPIQCNDAKLLNKLSIFRDTTFGFNLIESALQVAGRSTIRAPIAVPDRTRIVFVSGINDKINPIVGCVITSLCTIPKIQLGRIPRVVNF